MTHQSVPSKRDGSSNWPDNFLRLQVPPEAVKHEPRPDTAAQVRRTTTTHWHLSHDLPVQQKSVPRNKTPNPVRGETCCLFGDAAEEEQRLRHPQQEENGETPDGQHGHCSLGVKAY